MSTMKEEFMSILRRINSATAEDLHAESQMIAERHGVKLVDCGFDGNRFTIRAEIGGQTVFDQSAHLSAQEAATAA